MERVNLVNRHHIKKEDSMKASKWFITIIFVICCLGVALVAWCIEIESFNVEGIDKAKIVQGVITKIEGNKITIKDTSGKLLTVGVKAESQDKTHKENILRGLKVGDKVKIQGGSLTKITEPLKSDSGKIYPKTEHK
jgi:hypothetical protein